MKIFALLIYLVFAVTLFAQTEPYLDNKYQLAQLFEQENQLEKAELIYKELYTVQPWNYSYLDGLNRVLVRQKKYEASINLLEKRIKDNFADVSIYGLLGTTYYMMDNINKAYEVWDNGIKTNSNSYIVYRIIANYALENRLFEKAIELLNRGKQFAEDPSIFSLDLANIYSVNMRFEEAAIEYCNLLFVNPDQVGTIKSRLQNYFNRPGASESTIKVVKEFTERKKLPALYDLLSFCYMLSGNFQEAFNSTIEYDKISGGTGNYIFTFAQEALRNKLFDLASKSFKYFSDNFPQSPLIPIAKIGYSKTLEEGLDNKVYNSSDSWKPITKVLYEKEYLDVINSYEQIASSFADNQALVVETKFRIAEIYFNRLKNYSKADSIYNIVISKSPFSNFSSLSYLSKAKIAMVNNRLDDAIEFLNVCHQSEITNPQIITEAKFHLGLIHFWRGDFSSAQNVFKEFLNNLNSDYANDALEYSSLISASKKDSTNLAKFANAEKLLFQNKLKEAAIEFKTLADNSNLFILNEFAKYNLAKIFLIEDNFSLAIKTLEELVEDKKTSILADKSTFLLGLTYEHGIGDLYKASGIYQKLLENFPNSLYLDKVREYLNAISNKSEKK